MSCCKARGVLDTSRTALCVYLFESLSSSNSVLFIFLAKVKFASSLPSESLLCIQQCLVTCSVKDIVLISVIHNLPVFYIDSSRFTSHIGPSLLEGKVGVIKTRAAAPVEARPTKCLPCGAFTPLLCTKHLQ